MACEAVRRVNEVKGESQNAEGKNRRNLEYNGIMEPCAPLRILRPVYRHPLRAGTSAVCFPHFPVSALLPRSLLPVVPCWAMVWFPCTVERLRAPSAQQTWSLPQFPSPAFREGDVCGEPPYINPHTHVRSRKVRRARQGPRRLIRPRSRAGGGSPGISPRRGSRQSPSSVRFIRPRPRFRPCARQTARLRVRARGCRRRAERLQAHRRRGHHASDRIQESVHGRDLRECASCQRAGSAGRPPALGFSQQ